MEPRLVTGLLLLLTHIHSGWCQCAGTTLLLTAYDDYNTFTSPNYPSNYGNQQDCEWRIQADNVTDAIRLEILDAAIEYHAHCVYDTGEVFDGYNQSADSLGKFCGQSTPEHVSSGSYIMVTFTSDYSLSSKGFKARYKSGPRSSLVEKDEESSRLSMVVILGAAVGGLVFFLVLMVITITYIQAKKAKRTRRNARLRRGHHSTVQPYDNGGIWSVLDVPAPPAYGELYSSPMSPPPAYCIQDPNPNPSEPLPGRPEYMSEGLAQRQVTHVIQVHTAAGGRTSTTNVGLAITDRLTVSQQTERNSRSTNNTTPPSNNNTSARNSPSTGINNIAVPNSTTASNSARTQNNNTTPRLNQTSTVNNASAQNTPASGNTPRNTAGAAENNNNKNLVRNNNLSPRNGALTNRQSAPNPTPRRAVNNTNTRPPNATSAQNVASTPVRSQPGNPSLANRQSAPNPTPRRAVNNNNNTRSQNAASATNSVPTSVQAALTGNRNANPATNSNTVVVLPGQSQNNSALPGTTGTTQIAGSVAPLSTASVATTRATTTTNVLQNPPNSAGVASVTSPTRGRTTAANNAPVAETGTTPPSNTLERQRSYDSISEVSLPDSTRSRTISELSEYSDEYDEDDDVSVVSER